jgi:hypothetical protein
MSSDRKEEAKLPAGSPFWSKSYANFIMEKELEEAEAAVEECFRWRAGRAGLDDMLPIGRPMTEGEIDRLSEALAGRQDREQGQAEEAD